MASYKCPLCDNVYFVKQSLSYHVRTVHQGQPRKPRRKPNKEIDPYPCPHDDCRYSYNSQNRLINHLAIHHSTEPIVRRTQSKGLGRKKEKTPYPCPHPDCKQGYFYRKNLEDHLTLYHPLREPEVPIEPESEYYIPDWSIFMPDGFVDL